MASFEIILWIYNQALPLVITPLDARFYRFKVEAISSGEVATIITYSPDHCWIAEKVAMKCFTKKYIEQLGKLIVMKRPELF